MNAAKQAADDAVWQCTLCQHLYDPALGDPEHGIPPGTPFSELPDDWICPDCGMEKNFYARLEA